jgi:FkbM family methyltransferase
MLSPIQKPKPKSWIMTDGMNNKAEESGLPIFRDGRGLEVFYYAASETKFVYKEIFEDRAYLRHGITLSKGDCVWDIGANIGLFAVFLQENFEDVQVHSFEPSPEIFRILAANTARYGKRVVAHCCGIAGREGEATFTFYPNYSIMSGFHADVRQDGRTLRAGILREWTERYPDEPSPEERFLDDIIDSVLGQKQEIVCRLRTISQLIEETHTQGIDLLKIDAEGSELDILSGIRDDHWPAIRQIVMEIHDAEGSVATSIVKVLAERGFQTTVEQEPWLSGSGVVNCYAAPA